MLQRKWWLRTYCIVRVIAKIGLTTMFLGSTSHRNHQSPRRFA